MIDIIFISKYILGIQLLDLFYKMIVVDINCFFMVSMLDLILLCKVILGIIIGFVNNSSWCYVDVVYIFFNLFNLWEEVFLEQIDILMLMYDLFGVDFIVVKVGDVNGNVQVNVIDEEEGCVFGVNYYFCMEE